MEKSTNLTIPTFFKKRSPLSVVSYLLIDQLNRHQYFEEFYITPELIGFQYCKDPEYGIKNFSEVLKENSYIEWISENRYKVNRNSTLNLNESFITISELGFNKILKSKKHNKEDLILFYIRIADTIDGNILVNGMRKVIGHMPQGYFCTEYGMSKNTVTRYMKALEELEVIYIHRSGINKDTGNYQSNLYGFKENEGLIKTYANKYDNSNKSNFHRSVSARYNRYIDNPELFNEFEVKKLLEDCISYNKDMEAIGALEKRKQLDKIKQ